MAVISQVPGHQRSLAKQLLSNGVFMNHKFHLFIAIANLPFVSLGFCKYCARTGDHQLNEDVIATTEKGIAVNSFGGIDTDAF